MKILFKALVAVSLIALAANNSLAAGPGKAQLLEPGAGQRIMLNPVTLVTEPSLRGTVIYDRLIPFECGKTKGYLQDRVVKSKSTGKLHFYSGIRLTSAPDIKTVERRSFPKRVAVGYRTDGIGYIGPQKASRINDKPDHIVFDFAGTPVGPGEQSRLFFMMTTADRYDKKSYTTLSSYDGCVVSIQTTQPIW